MISACVWDIERTHLTHYDATITSVGVIITLGAGTPNALETLIPFGSGRIEEVTGNPGEIRESFTDDQPAL